MQPFQEPVCPAVWKERWNEAKKKKSLLDVDVMRGGGRECLKS